VTSKHDSRTILDTNGAEYLLGRGDSLYKPSGGKLMRLHGAFVSEDEIARVVDFWRGQCPQRFGVDFAAWQDEAKGEGDSEGRGAEGDELYPQAVEFVVSQGKASISLIQRRFRIGFNRAARFIEQMEMDGLLGPQEGSKPRSVIKGLD
jgi:S-DNA-T family DNA segregation ATPase FtsK/SpoIIIE